MACSIDVFAQGIDVRGKPDFGLLGWQGPPLTTGPLNVTRPPGWTKNEFFGTIKYFSPDSTPQQFLRLQFLPAEETTKRVAQRHSEIIGNLAGIMRPGTTQ